jgi:hypothetical protein
MDEKSGYVTHEMIVQAITDAKKFYRDPAISVYHSAMHLLRCNLIDEGYELMAFADRLAAKAGWITGDRIYNLQQEAICEHSRAVERLRWLEDLLAEAASATESAAAEENGGIWRKVAEALV